MIEVLLEAERALTHGRLDEAERLYRQVAEVDPRSSIALVGLARVALERGDDLGAYLHGRRALSVDPENPAAGHLVMRMAEVLAGRGETLPTELPAPPGPAQPAAAASEPAPAASEPAPSTAEPTPGMAGPPAAESASSDQRARARPPDARRPAPGMIERLLRRRLKRPR